jgi:hypothetical protein
MDVLPGETVTFQFDIVAPARPGTHKFRWRMLQEGVEWFGTFTPGVAIRVASPARCDEISLQIGLREGHIEGLRETVDQLDPRRDIARIRRINANIDAPEQEISNLRQEAARLGC